MSVARISKVEEAIKRFLIVGETLQGLHSYTDYSLRNLLTGIVLMISAIFSFLLGSQNPIWYVLFLGFSLGFLYFTLQFRIKISYAITKYRVIRVLQGNFLSSYYYRSSRFVGFSDLHYEHVERISIETPSLQMPRLYFSLAAISVGWVLIGNPSALTTQSLTLSNLSGLLFFIAGLINFTFSIPTGGVKLVLKSVSGESLEFPEKSTPQGFIDTLILNCRTFLSYGAK